MTMRCILFALITMQIDPTLKAQEAPATQTINVEHAVIPVTPDIKNAVEKPAEKQTPAMAEEIRYTYAYIAYQKMMKNLRTVLQQAAKGAQNLIERIDQSVHAFINKKRVEK